MAALITSSLGFGLCEVCKLRVTKTKFDVVSDKPNVYRRKQVLYKSKIELQQ
jgi:hypothetical protein